MLIAITSKDDPLQPDLLYLNGNIEIMVDDALMVVGPFEGALLLLPSLEVLALGVLRLRDLQSRVEVILVGDSPSLWFDGKPPPKSETVEIRHRQQKLGPLRRSEIDAAFEVAVREFLAWLDAQRPPSTWSADALAIRHILVLTWPSLA